MSDQPAAENNPPGLRLRVRMYRPGLGDCFLLSFFTQGVERHVLIDCGVYQGTPDSEKRMREIVRHIRRATNGRLDLVVVTHEHWDHLSGFIQAQGLFDLISIGEIWMAWTEDPTHPLANELREERSTALQTLNTALGFLPAGVGSQGAMVRAVLDFFGAPLGAAKVSGARQALDYLAGRQDARISYCQPGEAPRALEGLPQVRFFVLGPPLSEKLLKKTLPTKKGKEGYGLFQELTLMGSFSAALDRLSAGLLDTAAQVENFPFDPSFRIPVEVARQEPFFLEHYGFEDQPGHGESWRRIDRDWLGVASDLALQLDSATNNTSLVLAIELVESGQVLLFPGDAQVGSWLSWEGLSWDLPAPDGSPKALKAHDLLKCISLYKVGHHGSHNATLRLKGLELMESPQLAAMIPVDREMVDRQGWNMPFPLLFTRLQEKTRGRLIRLDEGLPHQPPLTESGLPWLASTEWKAFLKRSRQERLYIDYLLE